MDEHYKLIVNGEVSYFDDIEVAYDIAQDAVSNCFPCVSLWEWTAGSELPRWIEIPIEIEEKVN